MTDKTTNPPSDRVQVEVYSTPGVTVPNMQGGMGRASTDNPRGSVATIAVRTMILALKKIARGNLDGRALAGNDARTVARNTLEAIGVDW